MNGAGNTFREKKVAIDTINKKYLLSMALGNTFVPLYDECNLPNGLCKQDYYKEDFENSGGWVMIDSKENVLNPILKTMYNLSVNDFEFTNTDIDNRTEFAEVEGICFYYSENKIYASECYGSGGSLIIPDNYELIDGNLVIYSYTISYDNTGDINSIVDVYSNKSFTVSVSNSKIEDYESYVKNNKSLFTKHKSVYKKNSTGYYWYSTEVAS